MNVGALVQSIDQFAILPEVGQARVHVYDFEVTHPDGTVIDQVYLDIENRRIIVPLPDQSAAINDRTLAKRTKEG
jgi:hypothetical protein